MIVVDYQLAFTRGALAGDFPEAALRSTARICSAARALGAPVSYSYCALCARSLGRRPVWRQAPRARGMHPRHGRLPDRSARRARGGRCRLFEKQQPSAFFGSDLHERLCARWHRHSHRLRHHDLGLRPRHGCRRHVTGLPRRGARRGRVRSGAHAAPFPALFDMGHKYADVLGEREVLAALARR